MTVGHHPLLLRTFRHVLVRVTTSGGLNLKRSPPRHLKRTRRVSQVRPRQNRLNFTLNGHHHRSFHHHFNIMNISRRNNPQGMTLGNDGDVIFTTLGNNGNRRRNINRHSNQFLPRLRHYRRIKNNVRPHHRNHPHHPRHPLKTGDPPATGLRRFCPQPHRVPRPHHPHNRRNLVIRNVRRMNLNSLDLPRKHFCPRRKFINRSSHTFKRHPCVPDGTLKLRRLPMTVKRLQGRTNVLRYHCLVHQGP